MPSVMLRILVIDWPSSLAHIVTDTENKEASGEKKILAARGSHTSTRRVKNSFNQCLRRNARKKWGRMCDRRLSAQDGHLGWFREVGGGPAMTQMHAYRF